MTIASSITAIGNYLLDEQVIQPFLDDHLSEVSYLVSILSAPNVGHSSQPITGSKNLLFQVWSPDKKLILHSEGAQAGNLSGVKPGFGDIEIGNTAWRYFAKIDSTTKNKIIVAEVYEIRNMLEDEITRNIVYILLFTYPIFLILIWIIISVALRSITRVTSEISNRASTYLEPVKEENAPIEIQPLIAELNQLFVRLKLAFDRNKRFAGDAAHELKTPLAALKTNAQVALKSDNDEDRDNALQKVLLGVDRSSHLVAQLLTLSRLTQSQELNDIALVDLQKIATEIIADLVPIALEKTIHIELAPAPENTIIQGNDIAIGILIRNIVDNAIRYTPYDGSVVIQILNRDNIIIFRTSDTGPGIPENLRKRVFERFYRVLGNPTPGSGLGLAIVSQIAELHHARIKLSAPSNGLGLQFDVEFHQADHK